ncbi:hypothetical protein HDU93_001483 [Gonapodya sp. JEL0774]|nr:hypothetical protein HDU93_001483 [Gonapodya sp. JEL0774]
MGCAASKDSAGHSNTVAPDLHPTHSQPTPIAKAKVPAVLDGSIKKKAIAFEIPIDEEFKAPIPTTIPNHLSTPSPHPPKSLPPLNLDSTAIANKIASAQHLQDSAPLRSSKAPSRTPRPPTAPVRPATSRRRPAPFQGLDLDADDGDGNGREGGHVRELDTQEVARRLKEKEEQAERRRREREEEVQKRLASHLEHARLVQERKQARALAQSEQSQNHTGTTSASTADAMKGRTSDMTITPDEDSADDENEVDVEAGDQDDDEGDESYGNAKKRTSRVTGINLEYRKSSKSNGLQSKTARSSGGSVSSKPSLRTTTGSATKRTVQRRDSSATSSSGSTRTGSEGDLEGGDAGITKGTRYADEREERARGGIGRR